MGQQYLGGALLHKFERLHVQSFDLSALYSNPESVSARLFLLNTMPLADNASVPRSYRCTVIQRSKAAQAVCNIHSECQYLVRNSGPVCP